MPINSPNGNRIPIARRIRTGVMDEANALMTRGVKRPKIIKMMHSDNRRTAECQLGFNNFDSEASYPAGEQQREKDNGQSIGGMP